MKKINYYVGVLPADRQRFWDYVHFLNEDSDHKYHIHILSEFDDPHGYYMYELNGSWDSYDCFIGKNKPDYIKSVENFEE